MNVRIKQRFHDKDNFMKVYEAGDVCKFDTARAKYLIELGMAEVITTKPKRNNNAEQMTIKDYISQKLLPFGNISEAELHDMSLRGDFNLDDEYGVFEEGVMAAIIDFIEEKMLAPHVSSVNESGFSMSWDYSGLGKYYLWLCKKYGKNPDNEVLALSGVSTIIDRSDLW